MLSRSKSQHSVVPVLAALVVGLCPVLVMPADLGLAADASNQLKKTAVPAKNKQIKQPATLTSKWTMLHRPRGTKKEVAPIPKSSPLEVLNQLELTVPAGSDPFHFGNFKSQGEWGVVRGVLKPVSARNTACKLARGENFELEGMLNVEGLGGWFVLLGWDNGHGYMIYNVTLRTSGSPWIVAEFRGSKRLNETHREFYRFAWQGVQPLRMIVDNKKLSLRIGPEVVAHELPLPNYHQGDIIVGTYNTPYGPKPLQIYALRIRAR